MARSIRTQPAAAKEFVTCWSPSTIVIAITLMLAGLHSFFAFRRIGNTVAELNKEVAYSRQLMSLLTKVRVVTAAPPLPKIVLDRGADPQPPATDVPRKVLRPHRGIGDGTPDVLPLEVNRAVAVVTPRPTPPPLKPDLIGGRGAPIDDLLIKRIEVERSKADESRQESGRPWVKARPLAADGSTPKYRIAIVSLNARAAQRLGNPAAGGAATLNKRPDWQHRHSAHNKMEYCKKWGYDLIIEDNSIIDKSRDVAWSKIPIFKKWLPHYDFVMWVDMDAFFMRFDIPVEAFIQDDTKDMFIAKDWHGVNLGVFILKNSDFAHSLLTDMWRVPRHMWEPWQEQSALMKLLDPQVSGSQARTRETHILYVPQRDMNSYPQHFAYGNVHSLYQVEDPIAHFPNCKAFPQCRSIIERFYKVACKSNGFEPLGPDPIIPMRIVPAGMDARVREAHDAAADAGGGGDADGEETTTKAPKAKAKRTKKPKATAAPPTAAAADAEGDGAE